MEREYLDYNDWLNAGGYEGTAWDGRPEANQPYLPTPPKPGTPTPTWPETTPTTPPGGGGVQNSPRDPNAGPDGATTPNMDPPGYRGGYWMNGVWVQGSPYGGSSGGGSSSSLFGGGNGAASINYPDFLSAGRFAPRAASFSYESFAPSSYADLESQPGFSEGQDLLRKQIEAGAAYRGMLRSGMTLSGLFNSLDQNKEQRFAEFDNRRFRNWQANFNNALTAFEKNYGVDRDIYDRYAADVAQQNERNYKMAADDLARYQEKIRSLTTLGRPVD